MDFGVPATLNCIPICILIFSPFSPPFVCAQDGRYYYVPRRLLLSPFCPGNDVTKKKIERLRSLIMRVVDHRGKQRTYRLYRVIVLFYRRGQNLSVAVVMSYTSFGRYKYARNLIVVNIFIYFIQ